jgi:hypothetical protein
MFKITSRRKSTTFLDYQDGQVVSVEEDLKLKKEDEQKEPEMQEINIKGKTIEIKPFFKIATLVFGFLLCVYIVNHIYTGITLTGKVFAFLNSNYITASAYNNAYIEEQKTQQSQSGISSFNPLDFEGKKEYEKTQANAKILMEGISQYDQYLRKYYEDLKKSIITYKNGKSSYYLMNSSMENISKMVVYDYNNLLETTFEDQEIKRLFVSRYKILIAFLSSHIDNFTASKLVADTNQLIAEDNKLNLQEYELLKKYLKEHGVSYVYENNKIRIS